MIIKPRHCEPCKATCNPSHARRWIASAAKQSTLPAFHGPLRKACAFLAVTMLLGGFFITPAHAACTNPSGAAGTMIYNASSAVPQYCDDTNWVAMAPPGGFSVSAVDFDGANDWLVANTITDIGFVDSNKGTVSVWLKADSLPAPRSRILHIDSAKLSLFLESATGELQIKGDNGSNVEVMRLSTNGLNGDVSSWHHLLASWDLGADIYHVYLDNVSDVTETTFTQGQIINYADGDGVTIGSAELGTQKMDGFIADLWLDAGTYIDLSVESNRRKFRTANGKPAFLGKSGQLPTGAAPEIYLSGNAAEFPVNKGTGGGFTVTGALTNAATLPAPFGPVNLSIPSPGTVTNTTQLDDAVGVALRGDFAYVTADVSDGLSVINIANPASPSVVGFISSGNLDGAARVALAGNHAFVTARNSDRLNVIDITNPAAPVSVASITHATFLDGAIDIEISGSYAYIGAINTDYFTVVDISNPLAPLIVGQLTSALMDVPIDIAIQGDYAYVVAETSDRLLVIDISNPAAPVIAGSVTNANLDRPVGIAVKGNHAYVSAHDLDRITVVDISNPASPTVVGGLTNATQLNGPRIPDIEGDFLYVPALVGNRLTILNISDPVNPSFHASVVDGTKLDDAWFVKVRGTYAYSAQRLGNSFTIVDLNWNCTDPDGVAGQLNYNADSRTPMYCDGDHWVGMGDRGGWKELSAGHSHTCGIREDGTAWCWGANASGELGDGTTVAKNLPVRVGTSGSGTLFSDWVTISVGGHSDVNVGYSCGVRENGTGWCWGGGANGKLGNGGSTNQSTPQQVGTAGSGTLFTDWAKIDTGAYHTCGVRHNGTAWCWGQSDDGRLGLNSIGVQSFDVPQQVLASGGGAGWTDWVDISAGGFYNGFVGHTCGVRRDGSAWCWGESVNGRLGNADNTNDQGTPSRVGTAGTSTLFSDWAKISAGTAHTCGIRAGGTAWCWGMATEGRLGDNNNTTDRTTPVQVQASGGGTGWSDWREVSTFDRHTCGRRADNTLWCWGYGDSGRAGDNNLAVHSILTPTQVLAAGGGAGWGDWTSLGQHGQGSHVCAARADGSVWCWGDSADGKLGNNDSATDRGTPVAVLDHTSLLTDPALAAYWPLNESEGAVARDMAGSFDGAIAGGVIFQSNSGRISGAYEFVPNTQSIVYVFDNNLLVRDNFAISFWIYKDDPWPTSGCDQMVAEAEDSGCPCFDNTFEFYHCPSTVRLAVKNQSGTKTIITIPDSELPQGQWHHLVGVYDGTETRLYLNSVERTSGSLSGDMKSSSNPITIGAKTQGMPYPSHQVVGEFDGQIDDLRFYNRAISQPEISKIYNAGLLGLAAQDCTSPNGAEGTMIYNTGLNLIQYCDGANWVRIGKN